MISNALFYRTILFLAVVAQVVDSAKTAKNSNEFQVCNAVNSLSKEVLPMPAIMLEHPFSPDPLSAEHFSRYMAGSPKQCEAGIQAFQEAAHQNAFIRQVLILLLRHPRLQISFDTSAHNSGIEGETIAQIDRFIIHLDPTKPTSVKTLSHEATHLMLAFIQNHLFDNKVFPISIRDPDIQKIYRHSSSKADFDQLKTKWEINLNTLISAVQNEKAGEPLSKKEKNLLAGFRKAMENDPPDSIVEIVLSDAQAKMYSIGKSYLMSSIDMFRMISDPNHDKFTLLSKQKAHDGVGYIARFSFDDPLLAFIINQHNNLRGLQRYPLSDQSEEFITHAIECKSTACIRFLYPNLLEPLEEHMNTLLAEYPEQFDNAQENPNAYLYHGPYTITDFMSKTKSKIQQSYNNIIAIVERQELATQQELEIGISAISQLIQSKDKYDSPKAEAKDRLLLAELLYLKGEPKLALTEYKKAYKLAKESFDQFPHASSHYQKASQDTGQANAPGHIKRRIP